MKFVKVYLRLNTGIMTRRIQIPEGLLRTEFRVPIQKLPNMAAVRTVAEFVPDIPVMVFRWDRKSTADPQHVPIMDLVGITKY